MRALITGACGFVGRYLGSYLLECGDEVLGTVFATPRAPLPFPTQTLDVQSAEECSKLLIKYRPEVVYHLAGIAFVPEAEDNFIRALSVNVGGTHNILRACHLLELGTKVVIVSSAEVYGRVRQEDLPITESVKLQPANNYSLSKLMSEMVAPRYEQFGYVRSVVMRPFNHIGPGQDNRFVASSFAYQLARIAKQQIPPVMKVGNLEARRDFLDVRDVVRAYRAAAVKGQGVYNLASGRAIPIQEILDSLISISGLNVSIERDPNRMRAAEVAEVRGSYEKAKRELGWEPKYPLRETLEAVYRDWLARV